jgi:serine protease Do
VSGFRIVVQWVMCCIVLLAASASHAAAQSMRETIDSVLPKLVKIYGAGGLQNLVAYGTGMLVSPEGHVATVWSHVLDADQDTDVLNDGRKIKAKVLGAEPHLDLALLKIEADDLQLPCFDLAAAGTAVPGTRHLGFSNKVKVAAGDEPGSVLHGVVAARTKLSARRGRFEIPYDGPVYIVDAITNNSGAAGGALTTRDGTLIGMIGKELRNSESNTWVNYAVPIAELRDAITEMKTGNYKSANYQKPKDEEKPRRYAAVDFGIVMVPDVVFRTPAYIDSVEAGSAAAQAGLRPDDLILFVNDALVQSARMLVDELGRLEAGDTLRLIVRRGANLVSVELPVPRKPDKTAK